NLRATARRNGKGICRVLDTRKFPPSSCADLIRASIPFVKGFYEAGWIAGSSPAMTRSFARHARPCAGHPRLVSSCGKDVDGRDKPGHDARKTHGLCSTPLRVQIQPADARND